MGGLTYRFFINEKAYRAEKICEDHRREFTDAFDVIETAIKRWESIGAVCMMSSLYPMEKLGTEVYKVSVPKASTLLVNPMKYNHLLEVYGTIAASGDELLLCTGNRRLTARVKTSNFVASGEPIVLELESPLNELLPKGTQIVALNYAYLVPHFNQMRQNQEILYFFKGNIKTLARHLETFRVDIPDIIVNGFFQNRIMGAWPNDCKTSQNISLVVTDQMARPTGDWYLSDQQLFQKEYQL